MDLIKDLGPSGSDNDDDEQEEGLIIIPPQCHTPDSPSIGKIGLPRGSTSSADVKNTLFRQSVKNKLKSFTEGKVSLPGSPIPSKSGVLKKERKLTKDEDSIEENGTSVDNDKKPHENKLPAKGESPILPTNNMDTVGQNEVSCKNAERIEDPLLEVVEFSKKSVPRTNSIDRKDKIKVYPKSWIEIKEKHIDLHELRSFKDNSIRIEQKQNVDFRQQLLFHSPANLLNGLICKSVENKPNQRVAPQYLRYTNTSPQITWSYNPAINPSLTRSEIFAYIPSFQKNSIEKLVEVKNPLKVIDKKPFNKWYTKMPLLLCETEYSNYESTRLSFRDQTLDIESPEDLTPKLLTENQVIISEANLLSKKEKNRKKKRSKNITEDVNKKRSKKHKKEKKIKTEKPNLKKAKYIDDLTEQELIEATLEKSFKMSEPLKSSKLSHKTRKHSSSKSRSKSHEDIPRKGSSKSKPPEEEPLKESHTPKTEEYHSRWESDEELLKLERQAKKKYKQHRGSSKNMSWESDDENHARHKYSHHRSSGAERSLEIPLEMPLNIMHISRPKYNEDRHRSEHQFYSEDSWERGEYLKIRNELDNIELQKGRQTLSEERRQLEIEKRKIAEMELRLAEQRLKQQQFEKQQEIVVKVKEERSAKSKEKRYFENIGKQVDDEHIACEYHKSSFDTEAKRKSRWETHNKDEAESVSLQPEENYSPAPRPVSTSPFPFHKSPIAIVDVDNYSPKAKPTSPEVEGDKELDEIQPPTSNSEPIVDANIEKVVELENEYEQFMMSLVNAKETDGGPDGFVDPEKLKLQELAAKVKEKKAKNKKLTSSESSETTSSSNHAVATKTISLHPEKELGTLDLCEMPLITVKKPLIINQPLSSSGKPLIRRPRVPITILETIIIEDDDIIPVKTAKLPDFDLSKIELPPQFVTPTEIPLNLIDLPPPSPKSSTTTEEPNIELTPPKAVLEEIISVPPPEPPVSPPPPPPADEVDLPPPDLPESINDAPLEVLETPKEDTTNVKRNNLISIKFLSPKKRALEMNNSITTDASDEGEGDAHDPEDGTANMKRVFGRFNEPPSPTRVVRPIETVRPADTRPQLITVEQKAKLDQLRKETLDRNEQWQLERSLLAKETVVLKEEKLLQPEVIKDTKEPENYHKDTPATSSEPHKKEPSGSDRKKAIDSNKRRPSSKDRDALRKRSSSPFTKRRRMSPSRSNRERGRDRDQKDRQRHLSPRRGDKIRDRRDGKPRRSRSKSPTKSSKIGERKRSRDKSPKRRSGDRRDGRRPSPSRSRRRSPSPSSKRRSGHRERSRSPERKRERIEDTLKRLAGFDQFNTTSHSTIHHSSNPHNKSPRSSPLDGFKRSLADSTISDDQLLPSISESPNLSKLSPKSDYYKTTGIYPSKSASASNDYYHSNSHKHDATKSKLSPKRPSLDDRINQVLGIERTEVEEAPRRISTTYEGQYDYNKYSYVQPEYRGYSAGDMKADDGSRLVQMGNVLQIVPANNGGETSRSRKEHISSHQHPHHSHTSSSSSSSSNHHQQAAQQQILQVGNMLQIVPTALPTTAAVAPAATAVAAAAPPPPPPPPAPAEVQTENVLSSAEELLRQQHEQRKAEKELRRLERDRRRKEKERKQKEREKKKALRVKAKTEDMIKRALLLETEDNVDEDNTETAAVVEEVDEEVKWSPSNPVLAGALANLTKPVGKGILTSEKLSKLNVTKALELLTESRKQVKFADGIIPGEGTSPSAGEELTSPPPSGKRALKEKRHSKSLLSKAVRNKLSKKKVKVKVVRSKKHASRNNSHPASNPPNPNTTSNTQQSPSDAELDLLPPPSPPPGSPPPHIFPARVKPPPPPNNIHPATAAKFAPPAHYPYATAAPAGMIYATPGVVPPMVSVGGYAAPPPPPPPPPPVVAGNSGRYGASIPSLPPTHQLPHHLALRAGVSHKSRQ